MSSKITINLGYACNSDCVMCVLPNVGNPFFSTDEVREFIDEIDLKGEYCIEFCGGEPTLHRDFFDLCRYAVQTSGAEIWLMSHGRRFVDRSFAKDFARTGCKGAIIPLYSHNSVVHDEITQAKGSFHETLIGLENLQDLGVTLIIRFITMRQNYKDATDFMKLVAERFPKQRVLFTGLSLMGNAVKHPERLAVRYSEVKKYVEPALDIASENEIIAGLQMMPVCAFHPSYWRHFDPEIGRADTAANYWAALKIATEDNEFGYPSLCGKCKLKPICKWQWFGYEKLYGLAELQPQIELNPPHRQRSNLNHLTA